MHHQQAHPPHGSTQLELLVVIAVLAVIGGAVLIAYQSMADQAAAAHHGFSSQATDRALRTFSVLNGRYPDDWDSLLAGDATAPPFTGSALVDRLNSGLSNRLTIVNLTPGEVTALANVGITTLRDLDTALFAINTYDNDDDFTNDSVNLPNRIFDDAR